MPIMSIELPTPEVFEADQAAIVLSAGASLQAREGRGQEFCRLVIDLRAGNKVRVLMGSYENIKITTPEDLILAEEILKRR